MNNETAEEELLNTIHTCELILDPHTPTDHPVWAQVREQIDSGALDPQLHPFGEELGTCTWAKDDGPDVDQETFCPDWEWVALLARIGNQDVPF